jgi:hypothetical protein
VAVVVTVARGYDSAMCGQTGTRPGWMKPTDGYYINAAQAGEPPGHWRGRAGAGLGFATGQPPVTRVRGGPTRVAGGRHAAVMTAQPDRSRDLAAA